MKFIKNNLNEIDDSYLPQKFEGGGEKKNCNILNQLSQNIECLPVVGIIMEALSRKLININRTDVPIFLDSNTASFLDVAIHAKVRQYLSESTIEKHLRYARFMELHPMPVDFRNLTPEMFLRHIDYRIEYENATPNALKHEKRAVMMFLRAFKQYNEDWKEYIKTPPVIANEDNIYVPFPSVVNKLYKAKYSNDEYENILLQTIVFLGFNYGMRPPSEIINLNLEDVIINDDGTGYIRIHEKKKRNKDRIIYPYNKSILSSPVFKTPKNYVDNWRYKKATKDSGNALFLKPDGKRVNGNYIRVRIVPIFKIITKESSARLYTMRHTYATYLYEYLKDIKIVANRLGHRGVAHVDKYVHIADSIKEQAGKRNLFNQALRSIKKRGKPGKVDCLKKTHQSPDFSPREDDGPARI